MRLFASIAVGIIFEAVNRMKDRLNLDMASLIEDGYNFKDGFEAQIWAIMTSSDFGDQLLNEAMSVIYTDLTKQELDEVIPKVHERLVREYGN